MSTSEIKIGLMATLVGPYAAMGEDGTRGTLLALEEIDNHVAGKNIVLVEEPTNATPDSAVMAAESLLDGHGADIIIGPLSGNEGLAIRDFAKTRPNHTFINGIAGGQDMTLRSPAPNFFSFSTNGVQWMAGLSEYVLEQGYRKVVTVAEDYSYPHGQIAGFTIQYCRMGGKISQKFWVPLGTTDYRAFISALDTNIDAIFVALGGTDAVNFLQQYRETGRQTPLIGGSITIDQTVLNQRGELAERLVGTASSGPIADNNPHPAWQAFVESYRKRFPRALTSPSLAAYGYYVNTRATLLALQMINGSLDDGQQIFQKTLATIAFDGPTGPVRLDHNRNAIATNFLTVVDRRADGSLYNRLVKTIPDVNQTLGLPEDEYLRIGPFSTSNPPACP